jgi:hypothetical protein
LAQAAKDRGGYLRVGTDGPMLKIANGQGMWTLPVAILPDTMPGTFDEYPPTGTYDEQSRSKRNFAY